MRNSWCHLFRRLTAACAVSAASAWSSAMCYAQFAADDVTDSDYADGWQAGDNGGTGFTAWNFTSSYNAAIHGIDDGARNGTATSSTFNNIGPAFRMAFSPNGLSRAGRGFAAPLETGKTVRLVIDNPTTMMHYKGYIIRLSTGGANICAEGNPCTPGTTPKERLGVYMFSYDDENWLISDAASGDFPTPVSRFDSAAAGMQIDVTLTGPESYSLVMDPLGTAATYTRSGNLQNAGTGTIDWIEFVFFNTASNTANATDFYISSMQILDDSPAAVEGDYNNDGTVEAADYVVWRKHNGTGFDLPNEVPATTPGDVTIDDYNEWRERFGSPSGAGGASSTAAVPEPATSVSLALAAGGATLAIARHLPRFDDRA